MSTSLLCAFDHELTATVVGESESEIISLLHGIPKGTGKA